MSIAASIAVADAKPRWSVKPILQAAEVAALIPNGATVFVGGSGGGIQEPGRLLAAVEERFLTEGLPTKLTIWHCSGIGDRKTSGMTYLAHEGLIKRVVGGHWGMSPKMAALAEREVIEAYNLPQGVISQLLRETSGKRLGLVTSVGLRTFVDPRVEGGRLNSITTQDIVHVVELAGQEQLFYPSPKFDVALLRATSADELGNLSFSEEAAMLEAFSAAQAVKAAGGQVYVQAKYLVEAGSLHPHMVKVPGSLVDGVVHAPEQMQTALQFYEPAFVGAARAPIANLPVMPAGPRRIVAERAADEIKAGLVVNLGVGMPDGVAQIIAERGLTKDIAFAVEQGQIGGAPAVGLEFGAVYNAAASLDAPYQFDYFDGGGLDIAFLGAAEVDRHGNVNASRPEGALFGAGGFINISQGTRRVVFCCAFTAVGAKFDIGNGVLRVTTEGKVKKFVDEVTQITFSAERAREVGQEVVYVTERAVFRLGDRGLELREIAPGMDLKTDILDQMAFLPVIRDLTVMNEQYFQ